MLHLILLVLCWIFAAVALAGEVARGERGGGGGTPALNTIKAALWIGTPWWVALEGVYYLANRYVF